MEIKRLHIGHFRGIERLAWDVGGRFIGLVGPGDSTKTTILEAISLALTPRRIVAFEDTDFYGADTHGNISIEVTVGGVPTDLLALGRFGELVRGWSAASGLHDEPVAGDEAVLTVALRVDATLEPTWCVITDRHPDGKRISAVERGRLGVARIGAYVDWQLSWGQGSALTRLMEEKQDPYQVLADARRRVRASFDPKSVPLLAESAEEATRAGKPVGVLAANGPSFTPNLDVRGLNVGMSILALHDGPIPLRQAGLGTSRLLTTALQHRASGAGGVVLIDEVEHALEPHRLRRLLQVLHSAPGEMGPNPQGEQVEPPPPQVFLTTHSSVAVCELEPSELRIVRSRNGVTDVRALPEDIRPLLRTNAEAFLGRKVIVCEGKTEIGLCRAFDRWWSSSQRSFAYSGVVLADGKGNTRGPRAALGFAALEYETLFFGDSDVQPAPSVEALEAEGVAVVLWPENMCTEERVALDLPQAAFLEMVRVIVEERGSEHVQAKVAAAMGRPAADVPRDPDVWAASLGGEVVVRRAFARAAKTTNAEWFKRVDMAEMLGDIVTRHWAAVAATPLGATVKRLEAWLYA